MTTIHTGNTVTTGFSVSSDTSGDLVLKTGGSGGTTAATISGSNQQATFVNAISQPGAFMFRNKIINGNFDIWQRGTSQTTSGYGSADRWRNLNNGSTKTASQQAFTPGQTDVPNNPKYFLRHVVTSVAGASNYVVTYQPIEGVETLAGTTATLSFWAKADANKNIAVEFGQYFGSGGSPSSQVSGIGSQLVALTTSWTKYTITLDIPSISGKTLGTDGNDWLSMSFWFDAGSSNDSRSASLGQQSGTFDIAQVQLEEGSSATPFEQRFYETELLLCQRYCQTIGARFTGSVENGTNYSVFFPTHIDLRASPSVTVRSGFYFTARYSGTDVNIINPTLSATTALRQGVWALVGSSGLTAYRPIEPRMQRDTLNDFLLLSAEI